MSADPDRPPTIRRAIQSLRYTALRQPRLQDKQGFAPTWSTATGRTHLPRIASYSGYVWAGHPPRRPRRVAAPDCAWASLCMSTSAEIDVAFAGDDLVLRLSCAAYPARFSATSRTHCGPDLRLNFAWCAGHHTAPLAMNRAGIERYVGWMREIRRFKPATIARRVAVVTGFYRTCVIDGVLEHSPAEYVRRPRVRTSHRRLGFHTCSSKRCSARPGTRPIRSTSHSLSCSGCSAYGSLKPAAPT